MTARCGWSYRRPAVPSFARFADGASWYRNYTSVSGSTHFAVPALLSGTYPRDVLPTAANYPHNVFSMLGGGYEVHASEVIAALCPSSVCESRSRGVSALRKLSDDALDVWRQQVSLGDSDRQITAGFVEETESQDAASTTDDRRGNVFDEISESSATSPARLTEFVDGISTDTPTLEFIHLLLPHQPWRFYPSGRQYPLTNTCMPGSRSGNGARGHRPPGPPSWPASVTSCSCTTSMRSSAAWPPRSALAASTTTHSSW